MYLYYCICVCVCILYYCIIIINLTFQSRLTTMVYKYKRKKFTALNPDSVDAALRDVAAGMSLRKAAKSHGLSTATLCNRVSGKHCKNVGHPTVLSESEERQIVFAMELAAECGWPCNRSDLKCMVQEYCTAKKIATPWDSAGPKRSFLLGFEKRWKHRISKRRPQLLALTRASSLTKDVISSFLTKVEEIYETYGLTDAPERIFNTDEFGVCTDENAKDCFIPRGARVANILNPSSGKSVFTVLACGNAAGEILPPYVVYKGANLYSNWCEGGPDGAQCTCTPSGWMEMAAFTAWFEKVGPCRRA